MMRGSEGRFMEEDDGVRREGVVLFMRKDPKVRANSSSTSAPRGRDHTRKASPFRRDENDREIVPVSQHMVVLAMNKYPAFDGNPPSIDGRHEYAAPHIPPTKEEYLPSFARRSYRTPPIDASSNDSSPVTSPRGIPRQNWMEAWERAQGLGYGGLAPADAKGLGYGGLAPAEAKKRPSNPRGRTVSPPRMKTSQSPAPRNVYPAPRQYRNPSPAPRQNSRSEVTPQSAFDHGVPSPSGMRARSQTPRRDASSIAGAATSYRRASGTRREVDAYPLETRARSQTPLETRARSQTPRRSQCDPHGVQGWSPWADPELRGKTPPRRRTRTPPRSRNAVENVALDSMRRDLYAARTPPTQARKPPPPPNKSMAWASIPTPPKAHSRVASSPARGREQSVSPAPARFIDLGASPVVPPAVSEAVQTMSTSRAPQRMVAMSQAPFFEPNPDYWETPPAVKTSADRTVPGVEAVASEDLRKAVPKVLAYKGDPVTSHPRSDPSGNSTHGGSRDARREPLLPPNPQEWDRRILFDGDVSDKSVQDDPSTETPKILSYTGDSGTISAAETQERQHSVALPFRDHRMPDEEDASNEQLSTLGRLRWQQWTHFPSSDSDSDDEEPEPLWNADSRIHSRPFSSISHPRPSPWTANAQPPANARSSAPARKTTPAMPRKASTPPQTRYSDLAERARERCQQILREKMDVEDEEVQARNQYKTRIRKQRPTVSRHALDERVQAVYEEAEAARGEVWGPKEAHRQLNFQNEQKDRRNQQAVRNDSDDDDDAWLIIPRRYVKRSWPSERPLQRSPCPRMERVMAELLLHREDVTNVKPQSFRAASPVSARPTRASPPPRLPPTVGSWV